MNTLINWADFPARVLMSVLFFVSGLGKLAAVIPTQHYMALHGLPGFFLWPSAAFEIGSGVLLLIGLWNRPLSIILAGWCLMTGAIFHSDFADQTQQVMFMKNLAMAGGFLLLAKNGAYAMSLDRWRLGRGKA